MKRRKWAIALIILAGIALVSHYLILLRLPEAVRIILVVTKPVAYSLCFVCSFALCTRKRAHYAYYGLLIYQAIVLALSVLTMYWVQQSIQNLTMNENIPQWLLAMASPWYTYTQLGITVVLTTTVFILEFPKVNWMLGLIALYNLGYLLSAGIRKFISLLVRFPYTFSSPQGKLNISMIPLWIIGAIMLAIWELKKKDLQIDKEFNK